MLAAADGRRQERDARPLRDRLSRAGPHDQPQSMCPAFGSLRVGLRMRRTATILSGSACCVYGLTFTSHFYGARRSVGYVPFNSETLVTGKLFEDIREAVHKHADPALYDAIVIINLCVPTASGVPLQLLPKEINGVRIIGIDVPGFGVPTHAEAKDVLAGAMLKYARGEVEAGPGAAPAAGVEPSSPTRDAARRDVPGRPGEHRHACWSRWASPPARSCRRASGASSMPRSTARRWRRSIRSTPPASASSRRRAARSSARRRSATTAPRPGSRRSARPRTSRAARIDAAKNRFLPAIRGALAANADQRPHHPSGYEGSELLVARLLSRAAPTCAMSAPPARAPPWTEADREWLEAKGVHVQFRASLEQDLAAMREFEPDLAIGTTPVVQKAKELAIPALYFTNLISARPLMGAAGAGSLAAGRQRGDRQGERFDAMSDFFGGVGKGHAAGVWETRRRTAADIPRAQARERKVAAPRVEARRARREMSLMLVLDHDRAGGYWGAVYVFTADQGPAGRDRRPGRLREPAGHLGAALHRRAAAARAADRRHRPRRGASSAATAPKARCSARHATLDPDLPAVVVTGSIAEMIGGGVTPEGTEHPALPAAHHRRGPVAVRRPRDVLALVRVRRRSKVPARKPPNGPTARSRASTSSARSTAPSTCRRDLAEIRRLVEGIGAEVNMVFPLGSHLADVPQLVDADVNVCMYREFGRMLCEALERPYLQAPIGLHSPPSSCARWASCWASTPSRSSSARSTPRSSRSGTCGAR